MNSIARATSYEYSCAHKLFVFPLLRPGSGGQKAFAWRRRANVAQIRQLRPKVESGTSQSKSGIFFNFSKSGILGSGLGLQVKVLNTCNVVLFLLGICGCVGTNHGRPFVGVFKSQC